MTNINLVETSIKDQDSSQEFNFRWGEMEPQDISGQLTRSMLEMRKPKAYELKELPALPGYQTVKQPKAKMNTPMCPITAHSIELLQYIRQANGLLSKLENKSYAIYGYGNQIAELSQPPPFHSDNQKTISKDRRSRSSSSGKGDDNELEEPIFSAPELEHDFRDGKAASSFPCLSRETASQALKSSVIKVAAHCGYDGVQRSSLNVLAGVTSTFMKRFCDRLREALDHEAETGLSPFYDVLHSVLQDVGIENVQEIRQFWNTRILDRHKRLQEQAAKVAKEVQNLKYRMQEVKTDAVQSSSSQSTCGKWTPVAGMRSQSRSAVLQSARGSSGSFRPEQPDLGTSTWTSRTIKQEPYDAQSTQSMQPVAQRTDHVGASVNNTFDVKLEDNFESTFEFSEFDEYHLLRKRSRNAL